METPLMSTAYGDYAGRQNSGAYFSACDKYRYKLWRIWDTSKDTLVVILLNPSTAGAVKNDPTVRRMIKRAKAMGYGGVVVLNLFAFRTKDPMEMKAAPDPIGRDNDVVILGAVREAGMVICGWGVHGGHQGRDKAVLAMLWANGIKTYALRVTKDGHPGHPLYIPNAAEPMEFAC